MIWWGSSAILADKPTRFLWLYLVLAMIGLAACQISSTENDEPIELPAIFHKDGDLLQSLNASDGGQLPDAVNIGESIRYRVTQSMRVTNYGPEQPSKHNLWLALIRSIPPYQQVEAVTITPSNYELVTDEYGNVYAQFDLENVAIESGVEIYVDYEITLNRVNMELSTCEGELPDEFNQPELHIESNNPQIRELAQQLQAPLEDACQQVRAYYNYIGDNLLYTYNGGDWGAQAALGDFGADCTEYASLMVALCRAAGIPARYLEGLQLSGTGDEQAHLEHAWLEVYLPGIGWTPFDPTLGRIPGSRERYFAGLPADHIIVTVGRHPSTLRGASYYSHLYWGAAGSEIKVEDYHWQITPVGK